LYCDLFYRVPFKLRLLTGRTGGWLMNVYKVKLTGNIFKSSTGFLLVLGLFSELHHPHLLYSVKKELN